jgi:hypothetical protein
VGPKAPLDAVVKRKIPRYKIKGKGKVVLYVTKYHTMNMYPMLD